MSRTIKEMDVTLAITGVQIGPDGMETVEQTVDGRLQQRDGCWYLLYRDPQTGLSTTLKAEPDRVVLLRAGGTRLEIVPGRRRLCPYVTPYGELELGVTGQEIQLDLGTDGGQLDFCYQLDTGGVPFGEQRVSVAILPV